MRRRKIVVEYRASQHVTLWLRPVGGIGETFEVLASEVQDAVSGESDE